MFYCRKGFPNKMTYPEFKARYNILAANLVAKAKNDKSAANGLLELIKLDKEKYRCGHTKVFFRAGILGFMEEVREDRIGSVLAWLQAGARGKSSRMAFKKLQDQKLALYCCQRSIRMLMISKTWKWMQIWMAIKPNLKCTQFGKYKKEYEDKIVNNYSIIISFSSLLFRPLLRPTLTRPSLNATLWLLSTTASPVRSRS